MCYRELISIAFHVIPAYHEVERISRACVRACDRNINRVIRLRGLKRSNERRTCRDIL